MALEKYFNGKDPVTFCKTYPLEARVVDKSVLFTSTMEVSPSYKTKKPKHMVVYGIIEKRPEDFANQELRMMYISPQQFKNKFVRPDMYVCNIFSKEQRHNSKCFPLYYLHWEENSMHRATLESSEFPANFFITAGINGCSIFIEGSAENPTVYHANAQRVQPDRAMLQGLKEDQIVELKYKEKGKHMIEDVKKASIPIDYTKPCKGRLLLGSDYMDEIGPDREKAEIEFAKYAKSAKGLHPNMFRRKRYTRTVTNGTVFGVRDGKTRTWKFYIQKRVTGIIEFKYPAFEKNFMELCKGNNWVKNHMKEEFYAYQFPIDVQEIWPGGDMSHAYIHPNTPIVHM